MKQQKTAIRKRRVTRSPDSLTKREHGWLRFNEGSERWSIPDPEDPKRLEASHTARYNLKNLTQTQGYLLAEVFEAYHTLMTHPWGIGVAAEKVRAIRRALLVSEPREIKVQP